MSTIVMKCSCDGFLGNKAAARYQDAQNGAGLRVHNKTTKENTFRCTVCGTERGVTGGEGKKDSKKKS